MKSFWQSLRWHYKAHRITRRQYPYHGTQEIEGGKLIGATDTDYFHFFCPRCGPHVTRGKLEQAGIPMPPGPPDIRIAFSLDTELIGIKGETDGKGRTETTIILGLHCMRCKLTDLVKIPTLETPDYQSRPTLLDRIPQMGTPRE